MAKKKKVTASQMMTYFTDYVVAHNAKPDSVEDLAEYANFETSVFYSHFDSFLTLEQAVFKTLFESSLAMLQQTDTYLNFDKKDKLVSVYYTFFENLTLNRDYVALALVGAESQWKALSILSELKKSFTAFIDSLNLQSLNLNIESLETLQKATIRESSWVQFLFTLKFWLDDTSEAFEKTDILIEKSLNTSIELIDTKSLNNIIDLGKFLYKEKFKSN